MKRIFVILFLLIAYLFISAEQVQLQDSQPLFKITNSGSDFYDLEFNLSEFQKESVFHDNKVLTRISHPEAGYLDKKGYPELPIFGTFLAIPTNSQISIEQLSENKTIFNDYLVYPSQNGEEITPNKILSIDKNYYSKGENYPSNKILFSEPSIIRDLNLVNISFQPFIYNAGKKELEVSQNISVRIHIIPQMGLSTIPVKPKMSRAFEKIYQGLVCNYDQIRDEMPEYQKTSILMIYKADNTLQPVVNQLALWKRQMGYEVNLASTALTGTDKNDIKSYIQNAYNTWENPPEYVILIGNANQNASLRIPTFNIDYGYYSGDGDYPYSLLSGGTTDFLGDVVIGRLPIDTAANLLTIITKIKLSERNPFMGSTDWYHKNLLVGDPSISGQSCVDVCKNIKEKMLSYDNTYNFTEIYNSPFNSGITTALNSGAIFFNYRGFLGMSSWYAEDATNLSNLNKLANCVLLTCGTGAFASSDISRIQALVLAGTPTSPKGGATAIGMSTSHTHTGYNNSLAVSIFDGIFKHELRTMGEAMLYSKLFFIKSYFATNPVMAKTFTHWMNLMGDPSMEILMGEPKSMTINYPTSIAHGTNTIYFTAIDGQNQPVKDVWISMYAENTDINVSGYTNELGLLVLNINPDTASNITVTATKPAYMPHNGDIIFSNESIVGYNSHLIDDDNNEGTSGNSNQLPNSGESVELLLTLKNFTAIDVNGSMSCSSTDPYLTISDESFSFPSITSNSTLTLTNGPIIQISPACPNRHNSRIDIQIVTAQGTWNSSFTLSIAGVDLDIFSYSFQNGNTYINPGETADLNLTVNNNGPCDLTDIYAKIRCNDSRYILADSLAYLGNIPSAAQGSTSNNNFQISISNQILPGETVNFNIYFYNNQGYYENETLTMLIGNSTVHDPLRPDSYGYVCYDDQDIEYEDCPTYAWLELHEGLGNNINLTDTGNNDDFTTSMSLPFPFKFYGETYSNISICSNGWVSFGNTSTPTIANTFRNYPLPGPMGPSPIIAAFWDDLILVNNSTTGKLYTYYDPVNHYFVIEWYKAQNMAGNSNNNEETFEIILYDQSYYPTLKGDGKIKIQYKVFNNVDNTDDTNIEHQGYCTIGIQDPTATIGLQYTYDNVYPITAKHITAQTAILFTGLPVNYEVPHLVLGDVITNTPNDDIITPGEIVNLGIALENIGQSISTDISVTLSSSSQYLTITSSASTYNDIPGGSLEFNKDYFILHVADNCPESVQTINFNLTSANENLCLPVSLNIKKPAIFFDGFSLNDSPADNDGLCEPGETIFMGLKINNPNDSKVTGVIALVSTTDNTLIIDNNEIAFGDIFPNSSIQKTIPVQISSTAILGNVIHINLNISSTNTPNVIAQFDFVVGQGMIEVTEDFINWPPEGWTIDQHQTSWSQSATNFAGGTSPEVRMSRTPGFNGTSRLSTSYFDATGILSATASFKFMLDNYAPVESTIGLEIRNGDGAWTNIWNRTFDSDIPAELVNVEVPQAFINQPDVQFSFLYSGFSGYIENWYLDDFSFNSPLNETGVVSGQITFADTLTDLTNVKIAAGNTTTIPNDDGTYLLLLNAGNYSSLASQTPFYYAEDYHNLNIGMGTVLSNYDFSLEYMTPPQNVSYSLEDTLVTINWDAQMRLNRQSNKHKIQNQNDSRVQLQSYGIYKQKNTGSFIAIGNTTSNSFTDVIDHQNSYHYYVVACYFEGNSPNSEILDIQNNSLPPVITSYSPLEDSLVCIVGNSLNFSIQVTDSDSPFTCHWYVNDTLTHIVGTTFNYSFTESGMYQIKALVSDNINNVERVWLVYVPVENIDPATNYVTKIEQNSPNPFNPSTKINFELKNSCSVEIKVFNIKGQTVLSLVKGYYEKGRHSIVWNGKDAKQKPVASGIYFYQMKTIGYEKIMKAVLLK